MGCGCLAGLCCSGWSSDLQAIEFFDAVLESRPEWRKKKDATTGDTALHMAARSDNIAVVKLLCEKYKAPVLIFKLGCQLVQAGFSNFPLPLLAGKQGRRLELKKRTGGTHEEELLLPLCHGRHAAEPRTRT